jgi:hypothetical protein
LSFNLGTDHLSPRFFDVASNRCEM